MTQLILCIHGLKYWANIRALKLPFWSLNSLLCKMASVGNVEETAMYLQLDLVTESVGFSFDIGENFFISIISISGRGQQGSASI